MTSLVRALLPAALALAGCSGIQPAAPPPGPQAVAPSPAVAPPAVDAPPPAVAPPAAPAQPPAAARAPLEPKPPQPLAPQPAPAAPKAPATAAKPPAAKAPPAAASAKPPPAPVAAKPPPPALDLGALEQRIKSTEAIGVLTKLSLKNQVDDLVARFKSFHDGRRPPTLNELRPAFELLLMKVLSLLQDKDEKLARDIDASREALWSVLADREKLSKYL